MHLGILAHADVADRGSNQHALRTLQRAQHDFDREGAAILAPARQLDAGLDLLGQRILGGAQAIGMQPFGKALGDDVRYLLAEQFVSPL
jgi:hypothetical protein